MNVIEDDFEEDKEDSIEDIDEEENELQEEGLQNATQGKFKGKRFEGYQESDLHDKDEIEFCLYKDCRFWKFYLIRANTEQIGKCGCKEKIRIDQLGMCSNREDK